ncbi:MAG TPA: ATP-binding protein [Flavisolibacter sp.]|nr:ATP-binding protein [Flavisolibacter sp.]
MIKLISIFIFAASVQHAFAQDIPYYTKQTTIDSLKHQLQSTKNDTLQLVLVNELRYNYFFGMGNFDSALVYSKKVYAFAQQLGYKIDEAYALDLIGDILNFQHSEHTLETLFKGVQIAEDIQAEKKILPPKYLNMMTYWNPNFTSLLRKNGWSPHYFRLAILGSLYQDLGHAYGKVMPDQQKLLFYLSKAIKLYHSQKDTLGLLLAYNNIAEYFFSTNQFDSSLIYLQKGISLENIYSKQFKGYLKNLALLGTIHYKKGDHKQAYKILQQSIALGAKFQQLGNGLAFSTLSEYFWNTGAIDSSYVYATEAYRLAKSSNLPDDIQKTSAMLAKLYWRKNISDSALNYFEIALALNDSINNGNKKAVLQRQDFEQQKQQEALEQEKARSKFYTLIAGIAILLIIALFLIRNNYLRKRANAALQEKNIQIERTLNDLQATQKQLIQSEKMASLGELTAGIAHEIQNPLNFVNNFSEVNSELINELKEEAKLGNTSEVLTIADDVDDNLQKIIHHGKRADAIVKSMLQHSRKSSGQKEPTDINALVDEYLRLSYHGLRAKDKSFNAVLETHFDPSVSRIEVVGQDIGRVLLNLFNNAFYSVSEKKKSLNDSYQPEVQVTTEKHDGQIFIKVKDNGTGIPEKVQEKIYQPFFTTKPTGEGTGLGLSLSYDIVTKGHGGEMKVKTKEGEGAEFIITLPLQKSKEDTKQYEITGH